MYNVNYKFGESHQIYKCGGPLFRMKRLFKLKYPKLIFLALMIIFAYLLFSNLQMDNFLMGFENLQYASMFIAGMIFAFGFTAPFAIGFFLISNPQNPFFAAVVAGLGAMLCNLILFSFLRISFMNEYKRLEKTKPIQVFESLMKKEFSHNMRVHLLYAFAGLMFASPLPDEIGDIMLAGLPSIKKSIFALITFTLSTLGIYLMLLI